MMKLKFNLKIVFLGILFAPFFLFAQKEKHKKTKDKKQNEFVIAPYINYGRTLGLGYGIVPMYSFKMNKNDTISPKSIIGLALIGTTNKTYAGVAYGSLFFKEDKWRFRYGLGWSDYRFQTYYEPIEGEMAFFWIIVPKLLLFISMYVV